MAAQGTEYLHSKSKRALDVMGGLTLAATLLPLGVAAAAATVYDHKSLNPFYQQQRQDGNGKYVTITKFRSLHTVSDDMPVITYGTFDPRASRIGNVLRQSGLDELPQLANVIAGSMSLVGRRPVPDVDLELFKAADPVVFKNWEAMLPDVPLGLTSKTQIYRHYQQIVTDEVRVTAMRLDLEYAETASLTGDLAIIGRTPFALLRASMQQATPVVP